MRPFELPTFWELFRNVLNISFRWILNWAQNWFPCKCCIWCDGGKSRGLNYRSICMWGRESLIITWWEEKNVFISFNSEQSPWCTVENSGVQWCTVYSVQWQPRVRLRGTLSGCLLSDQDTSWPAQPLTSEHSQSYYSPPAASFPSPVRGRDVGPVSRRDSTTMIPDWLLLYFSLLASFTHSYSGAGWLNYTT